MGGRNVNAEERTGKIGLMEPVRDGKEKGHARLLCMPACQAAALAQYFRD